MDKDKSLHLVVESDVLKKLLEQFEVKQNCMGLKERSPRVYCSEDPGAEYFELTPV